ncbi:MAG TPA: hypothetical protein VFA63_08720, partial [Pseudonocardiaceae bacterium]|nr:hypothetical protein [Pseudonocardiaceae bacterium]
MVALAVLDPETAGPPSATPRNPSQRTTGDDVWWAWPDREIQVRDPSSQGDVVTALSASTTHGIPDRPPFAHLVLFAE